MRLFLLIALASLVIADASAQNRPALRREDTKRTVSPRPAVLSAAPAAGSSRLAGSGPVVLTVTSAADTDDGACDAADCTLVEAITAANAAGGPAVIRFQIAGGGTHQTIVLDDEPPALDVPVVIDGDTQGCADRAAGPCVTIDASLVPDDAFDVFLVLGGNSQIRNLHFVGDGLDAYSDASVFSAIDLASSGNVVAGCVVGGDRAGTTADPDGQPGTGDELGFVSGINVLTFTGEPEPPSTGNRIGGPAPADRNVVLGHQFGISVLVSPGNTVQNNVVSGNAVLGISVSFGSTDTVVAGNLVGLDRTGTRALPNGDARFGGEAGNGIQVDNGSARNRIGGPAAADANVVSGNLNAGIVLATVNFDDGDLVGDVAENVVEGNRVGTNAVGLVAIPNGAANEAESGAGIVLVSDATQGAVRDNTVRGNLVAGNLRVGLLFDGTATTRNVAEGNRIGLAADGQTALPNGAIGVGARGGAAGNRVGSETAPNTVAFQPVGVGVLGAGTRLDAAQNVFRSVVAAVDLGLDGATANDAGDADEGPNRGLNAPVVESAAYADGRLSVAVRLDAPPPTATYPVRVTLYDVQQAPAGQMLTPLGTVTIAQAQAGQSVTGSVTASTAPVRVVAVATDAAGNTSEAGTAPIVVAGEAVPSQAAAELRLAGPNPFRAETAVSLAPAVAGAARVDLLDALGRTVAVLHDGPVAAGAPLVLRLDGARLAPGAYAVRASGAVSATIPVVRVR